MSSEALIDTPLTAPLTSSLAPGDVVPIPNLLFVMSAYRNDTLCTVEPLTVYTK
jgi:hypothetical protein